MFTSKVSLSQREPGKMVRPLSRKDIFYSRSITNLQEYQSQKSLTHYRNSTLSLTKYEKSMQNVNMPGTTSPDLERGERK